MKKFVFQLIWIFMPLLSWAQGENIQLTLTDAQTGEKISGAIIIYNQKYAISDENGVFILELEENREVDLSVNHIGYESYEKTFRADELMSSPMINLKSSLLFLEEVLVSGNRRPLVSQTRIDRETVMRSDPKNIGDIFKGQGRIWID
jgi:hypothetical protein